MHRRLQLTLVDAEAPPSATLHGGCHELSLDLRKVFHHRFIDRHNRPPRAGTNPLFGQYAQLLVPGDKYLRFYAGISTGDDAGPFSHEIGRAFARAALADYGYRWFARIGDLLRRRSNGWSVTRPRKGNMPDWLVAGGDLKPALAEAKGTRARITQRTPIVRSWRKQVTNAAVKRNGTARAMKSWIVATRWVDEAHPKEFSCIYIEDPETRGAQLNSEDVAALEREAALVHTAQNLLRLGLDRVAERLLIPAEFRTELPSSPAPAWSCSAPGLTHLRFVGRVLSGGVDPWSSWLLRPWLELLMPDRWRGELAGGYWFDGVAATIPMSLSNGGIPEPLEVGADGAPGVSLLEDGSIIAPMELMEPSAPVTL